MGDKLKKKDSNAMDGLVAREKRVSQKRRIAEFLMTGRPITQEIAYEHFGASRLSAVIFELKESGFVIKDQWIPTSKPGFESRAKQYFM